VVEMCDCFSKQCSGYIPGSEWTVKKCEVKVPIHISDFLLPREVILNVWCEKHIPPPRQVGTLYFIEIEDNPDFPEDEYKLPFKKCCLDIAYKLSEGWLKAKYIKTGLFPLERIPYSPKTLVPNLIKINTVHFCKVVKVIEEIQVK